MTPKAEYSDAEVRSFLLGELYGVTTWLERCGPAAPKHMRRGELDITQKLYQKSVLIFLLTQYPRDKKHDREETEY